MEKTVKKKAEEPEVVKRVHKGRKIEKDQMIVKPKVTVLSTERELAIAASVNKSEYSITRSMGKDGEKYVNLEAEIDLFSSNGEKINLGDYFSWRTEIPNKDLKRAKQWIQETRNLADLLNELASVVEKALPKLK